MGIVLNLLAFALTIFLAVKYKSIRPGIIWLCVVIVINTIPLFILPDDDPRRMTMLPNTMIHFALFAVARGGRRLFSK